MVSLHFDEQRDLICECPDEGHLDEHHISIEKDGTIVISCCECGEEIRLGGVYIDTKILPENSNNPGRMTVTVPQADYWLKVALKDLDEHNEEGAKNVWAWLKENNAKEHALKLRDEINKRRMN